MKRRACPRRRNGHRQKPRAVYSGYRGKIRAARPAETRPAPALRSAAGDHGPSECARAGVGVFSWLCAFKSCPAFWRAIGWSVCRFGASRYAATDTLLCRRALAVLLTLHATAIPTKKESSLAELKRGTLCQLRKPQPRTLSVALRGSKPNLGSRKPRSSMNRRRTKHNRCQLIDSRCVRDLARSQSG